MIFFGNGIVLDKENGKVLCRFVNGRLETLDVRVIKQLEITYQYELTDEDFKDSVDASVVAQDEIEVVVKPKKKVK